MNNYRLRTLIFVTCIIFFTTVKAQKNLDWQPVTLNVHDGTNAVSGIQAYCALATCSGSPRLLIKLINSNPYTIRAGWKDAVLINNNDERHFGSKAQDSVTIGAKSEITGDCSGTNPQLVLDLSDFGANTENFTELLTPDFDFVKIP